MLTRLNSSDFYNLGKIAAGAMRDGWSDVGLGFAIWAKLKYANCCDWTSLVSDLEHWEFFTVESIMMQ